MKRGMIFIVIILFAFLSFNSIQAQTGPSWLVQGDLYRAVKIWDMLEIPNTNIILAAGKGYSTTASIWKSTNNGQNWERKFISWDTDNGVLQLAYDPNKNIVFGAIGNTVWSALNWKSIVYSTDQGETWVSIWHPAMLGDQAGANSIIFLNNKLYIAYMEKHYENGNYWGIYSAMLFRIDVSSYNPSDWYWEFLMQYPEMDYIMRLAEKDGKLYVFGKDWNSDAIRVFTYDTQTLDRMATRIGTVEEVRQQIEQYQAQLTQQENETVSPENVNRANTVNEEAQR